MLVHVRVRFKDTFPAPFAGLGPEGIAGTGQGADPVVKLHTGPDAEPQSFLATIFQK